MTFKHVVEKTREQADNNTDDVRIYCTEDECEFEDIGEFPSLPTWCPDCGTVHSVTFEQSLA